MFGYSVCIHNNTIVVGAYGDSLSGSSTGAVYIFRKTMIEFDPKELKEQQEEEDASGSGNITTMQKQPWVYEWVEIQKLFPGEIYNVDCASCHLPPVICQLAWPGLANCIPCCKDTTLTISWHYVSGMSYPVLSCDNVSYTVLCIMYHVS